jgi:hypothetical protein
MKNELILKISGGLSDIAIKALKTDLKVLDITHSQINNIHRYFIPFTTLTKKTITKLSKYNPSQLFIPKENYHKLQEEIGSLEHLPWINQIS